MISNKIVEMPSRYLGSITLNKFPTQFHSFCVGCRVWNWEMLCSMHNNHAQCLSQVVVPCIYWRTASPHKLHQQWRLAWSQTTRRWRKISKICSNYKSPTRSSINHLVLLSLLWFSFRYLVPCSILTFEKKVNVSPKIFRIGWKKFRTFSNIFIFWISILLTEWGHEFIDEAIS